MVLRCIKIYRIMKERSRKSVSYTGSLKQDYLNIFEGIKSDVMYTALFDDNNDRDNIFMHA